MHSAALPADELLDQCSLRLTRGSGPGGQHRNKVETAVVLTHEPTGVQGAASERRSQGENRKAALFRLRVNLAIEVRSDPAKSDDTSAPAPSELWQSRCRGGKVLVNPKHDDFPALLAEALDAIAAADMDAATAARALGCTISQLVKLLKHDPRGLAWLNASRKEQDLPPLR